MAAFEIIDQILERARVPRKQDVPFMMSALATIARGMTSTILPLKIREFR